MLRDERVRNQSQKPVPMKHKITSTPVSQSTIKTGSTFVKHRMFQREAASVSHLVTQTVTHLSSLAPT